MLNDGRKKFIEVRQLRKSFAGKPVLQGVTLDVFEGETVVVLGGSGEGKSVLLRHLNGLERPDSGEVIVDGRRLNDLTEDAMADIRKEVAMVFQGGALFDSFTVFENVSYPLREHGGMDEAAIGRRVTELLEMVGMPRVEHLYPAELSGGMKKRVALARSIALQPEGGPVRRADHGIGPPGDAQDKLADSGFAAAAGVYVGGGDARSQERVHGRRPLRAARPGTDTIQRHGR